MNVLFVYAHQDPASYGATLHNRALHVFQKLGYQTTVIDLYGLGFQPVPATWDFKTSGGAHQNYMEEQKRAARGGELGGFSADIADAMAKVKAADLIVFEFPLWWSAPPAIVKGWLEKVFAFGVAWTGEHRYVTGLLRGKQALAIVTAGDPESFYTVDGMHRATITQHLYPFLHGTLAHCGLDVYEPFIAANLTAASEQERKDKIETLDGYLKNLQAAPKFIFKHA